MRPQRLMITDRIWTLIEPMFPRSHRSRGVTGKDNRLFVEAVLWKGRVGAIWRDLVENDFSKIKEFRGIDTRYDKTDTSDAASWYIDATAIALR